MILKSPYLLFLGDIQDPIYAKTAQGIVDWNPSKCIGQHIMPGGKADLGIPQLSIPDAAAQGAKTLIVGVAPPGGRIPETWFPYLFDALDHGLNIASGLHDRLDHIPGLREAADSKGLSLQDVREVATTFIPGTGAKRSGKRLLTVGTDCAVGKKYTALAINKELNERGINSDFRATGQTGIMIAGGGVPLDAVVCDFTSGAAESISPSNKDDHWDIIEGQGSLFHPSYAGVTLSLIHGSQPDALVLCHEVGRIAVAGLPDYELPNFQECMETYIDASKLTNKNVKFVGVSLNTSNIQDDQELIDYLGKLSEELKLPCEDPMRSGVKPIADMLEVI